MDNLRKLSARYWSSSEVFSTTLAFFLRFFESIPVILPLVALRLRELVLIVEDASGLEGAGEDDRSPIVEREDSVDDCCSSGGSRVTVGVYFSIRLSRCLRYSID